MIDSRNNNMNGGKDVTKAKKKSNSNSGSGGGFQSMGLSEEVYRGIVKMGFWVRNNK